MAGRAPSVREATLRDLNALPEELRQGALAMTALRLAQDVQSRDTPGYVRVAAAKELREHLDRLRELAAELRREDPDDRVDDLQRRRAERRAGLAAGT